MTTHIHWHITRVATLSFLELPAHRNESFVQTSTTFTDELWNIITSGLTLKGAHVRALSCTNWPLSHYTHRASIFRLLLLLLTSIWSSLLFASTANGAGCTSYQNTGDHSPKHSRQPPTILTKQTDTPNATLLSRISANRYCLWINFSFQCCSFPSFKPDHRQRACGHREGQRREILGSRSGAAVKSRTPVVSWMSADVSKRRGVFIFNSQAVKNFDRWRMPYNASKRRGAFTLQR